MNINLIEALEQLETEKGIKKEEIIEALERSLKVSYKKAFGEEEHVEIKVDQLTGEISIYRLFFVVEKEEDIQDPSYEIDIKAAHKIKHNAKIGEEIRQKINVKKFNRIAAQTAKQVLIQKLRELEKDSIYTQYKDMENTLASAEVMRPLSNGYEIRIGKVETVITQERMIPGERYENGKHIKVYIETVEKSPRGAYMRVNRTSREFLKMLLFKEVPELTDGTMEIVAISREPGVRSKVALRSSNHQVDPVGACIGENGTRITNIVKELSGEKVDAFEWSDDIEILIRNALAPAEVIEVEVLDEENKISRIWVPPTQLSLAIGKGGQNARLAARLTGWKIDIKPILE